MKFWSKFIITLFLILSVYLFIFVYVPKFTGYNIVYLRDLPELGDLEFSEDVGQPVGGGGCGLLDPSCTASSSSGENPNQQIGRGGSVRRYSSTVSKENSFQSSSSSLVSVSTKGSSFQMTDMVYTINRNNPSAYFYIKSSSEEEDSEVEFVLKGADNIKISSLDGKEAPYFSRVINPRTLILSGIGVLGEEVMVNFVPKSDEEYKVSFTPTVRISEVALVDSRNSEIIGNTISIANIGRISLDNALITTRLPISNEDILVTVIKGREVIPSEVSVSPEGTQVAFRTNINAQREVFNVLRTDISEVSLSNVRTIEIEDRIPIAVPEESVPDYCMDDSYIEVSSTSCNYASLDATRTIVEGRDADFEKLRVYQRTYARKGCPISYFEQSSCRTREGAKIEVMPLDSSDSLQRDSSSRGEVSINSFVIYDWTSSQNVVAVISFIEDSLNLFLPVTNEQAVHYSPSFCQNGIQDNYEDGLDCGGPCPNECVYYSPKFNLFDNFLIYFSWAFFIALSSLGIFFSRDNESANILSLISLGKKAIINGDIESAKENYFLMKKLYNSLPQEKKNKLYVECLEYANLLRDKDSDN